MHHTETLSVLLFSCDLLTESKMSKNMSLVLKKLLFLNVLYTFADGKWKLSATD